MPYACRACPVPLSRPQESESRHVYNSTFCQQTRTVVQLVRGITIDRSSWPVGGVFLTSNVSFYAEPGSGIYLDFNLGVGLFNLRGSAGVRVYNLIGTNMPYLRPAPFTIAVWPFNFQR